MSQNEKKIVHATKWSTWMQRAVYPNPSACLLVLDVWIKAGEVTKYTLLKLGSIDTTDIDADSFNRLIEKKVIVEWKPEC